MTERANIVCLCGHLVLRSLGLNLRKGESGWVSADKARSSEELERHRLMGAVQVSYVEREQMPNRPPPQWRPTPQKVQHEKRRTPAPPPPPKKPPQKASPDYREELRALNAKVENLYQTMEMRAQEMSETLQTLVDGQRELEATLRTLSANFQSSLITLQALQTHLMSSGNKADAETLAAVVSSTVAQTLGHARADQPRAFSQTPSSVVPSERRPKASSRGRDDEPVFIPSGMVDKDKEVSVQTTSQEEDVSGAAASLRQFKKNKRR